MIPAKTSKEIAKKGSRLISQDLRGNFDPVIQPHVFDNVAQAPAIAGLGIAGGKNQSLHAAVDQRSCTHGTRLEGYEELASSQPPTFDAISRLPNREDLGVGEGIAVGLAAVSSTADDLAPVNDHGADGNLSFRARSSRLDQRLSHPIGVYSRHFRHVSNTVAPLLYIVRTSA